MTTIRSTTAAGGRKPSEETREKLRAAGRAGWDRLTPEQQEARRAALAAGRSKRGAPADPAPAPPADPAPPPEGSRSPLDDAPRARVGGASPAPRREGLTGAPVFRVPDFAALPEPEPIEQGPGELTDVPPPGGVTVNQAQVETLLKFPFELVALRRGRHWKLRADEAGMVAEPLTRKINESALASRAIAAGGDWAVIIGGLAIIVSGRLAEDAKDDDRADARARDDDGARARGVPADDDRDDGPRAPLRSVGGHGGGTLNGFSVGPDDLGGTAPVAPEARGRPLVQAL